MANQEGFLNGIPAVGCEDVFGDCVGAEFQFRDLTGTPAVDEAKGAEQPGDADAVGVFEGGGAQGCAEGQSGGASGKGGVREGAHGGLGAPEKGTGGEGE